MLARVYAMALPSVCHIRALYQNGCTDRADFCMQVSLDLCYSVLKEIREFRKIRVVPSGTLSQSLDFKNFARVCNRSVSEIYSDSGRSAVDSSAPGSDGLAGLMNVAYSIGLRPLISCLSHWMCCSSVLSTSQFRLVGAIGMS